MKLYPFTLAVIVTATVLAPSFGHPQPQSKNPKRLVTTLKQKDEVVKIKSLRVKGQKANFNEAFEASEDWIDNLTIEVGNTSGRNIVGVEVRVSIPLNDSGSLCNLVLSHGKVQPSPIAVSDNDLVKPGGMVNLVVSQDDVQWLKRQLKERGSRDSLELKEASVWTSAVFFEDGTVWSGGDTFNPKGQRIVGKSDDNGFLKLGFKTTNFTPSFDDTGGAGTQIVWHPAATIQNAWVVLRAIRYTIQILTGNSAKVTACVRCQNVAADVTVFVKSQSPTTLPIQGADHMTNFEWC